MQAETFLFRRAAGRKLRRWVRPTRKARMSRFDKSKLQAMFGGKGFYIALAVCLLAAGTIGYITLFSSDSPVKEPDPVIEIKPAPVTPAPAVPTKPVIQSEPVEVPVQEAEKYMKNTLPGKTDEVKEPI